jgi:hypothetical protein
MSAELTALSLKSCPSEQMMSVSSGAKLMRIPTLILLPQHHLY